MRPFAILGYGMYMGWMLLAMRGGTGGLNLPPCRQMQDIAYRPPSIILTNQPGKSVDAPLMVIAPTH